MSTLRRALATVTVTALLLVGCGGDDAPSATDDGATSVTVATTEFVFDPDTIRIAADSDVTIVVDNSRGVVEHDLTVDALDLLIHADPGQTTSGQVNAAAGTYEVYCSVPGHREAGMVGTLVVG